MSNKSKVTKEVIKKACELRAEGFSFKVIEAETGLPKHLARYHTSPAYRRRIKKANKKYQEKLTAPNN